IDGTRLAFVDCPEFPAWITSEWTRRLGSPESRESSKVAASSVRLLLAPRRARGTHQSLFPEADVNNAGRDWFSQFKTGLSTVDEPGDPMYKAQRAHDILRSCLRAAGRVELLGASGGNHLADLWGRTKISLVISSPDWKPDLLLRVLSETVLGEAEHDAHLILLDSLVDSRKPGYKSPLAGLHPDRRAAGEFRTTVLREALSGTYCLVDGRILRWGTLDTLLSSSTPLVEITGTSGIAAISAAISARLPDEGRWWIDQQLTPNDLPNSETKVTERKTAAFRAELKALMLEASERMAIGDQLRTMRTQSAIALTGGDKESANDGLVEVEDALAPPPAAVFDDIIESARAVLQQLSEETFECAVAIRSPFETLVEICRFAENYPSKLTVTIVVSSIPADIPVEWAKFFGDLTRAANPVNIRLCLTHPASNKSVDRLQKTFGDLLTGPLFSYSKSQLKFPNLAIVTGGEGNQKIAAVAISEGNWFSDRSQVPGIAFHSRELADRLTILTRERDS
ncbi:MAG TPA: hypothetical protein VNH18_10765, partial [Bryobacteraceae bacterium]|nr:hypothetical protein [Bryobacteraceae bacterium]